MTDNGSESLPFELPEQENIRLREENARLRRLLAIHSISIPQLAPENLIPAKPVETTPPAVDKEERARNLLEISGISSSTLDFMTHSTVPAWKRDCP